MLFYEILEQFIGAEIELFENRTTGRLEIRPADIAIKKGTSGKYISDVGQDYVVIEFASMTGSHFDAYPFAQVTMRNWNDQLVVNTAKKQTVEEKDNRPLKSPPASSERSQKEEWF